MKKVPAFSECVDSRYPRVRTRHGYPSGPCSQHSNFGAASLCVSIVLLFVALSGGAGNIHESKVESTNAAPDAPSSCSKADMSEFVHMDPSRWRRWYFEAYASSARFNERAANAAQQQLNSSRVAATASSKKWQIGQDSVNDMPVALVNMPFRKDRRAHSLRLLHELGLQNVHAPALVSAEALNMSNLIEKGLVVGAMFEKVTSGDPSASAYVARAADQIAILRHFVALGHGMFAIFEDDLWPAPDARAEREAVTGEGGERKGAAIAGESTLKRERRLSTMAARERIQSVVTALPATADLLYLEFCGELCAHLRYTVGNTLLARAKHPFCSQGSRFSELPVSRSHLSLRHACVLGGGGRGVRGCTNPYTHTRTHTFTNGYTRICTCTNIHTYTYTYKLYISVYICIYLYIYMYMYEYIYI